VINVFIKTGDVIKGDPENRDKQQAQKISRGEFYGNVDSEKLGFDNSLPKNKKGSPANGSRKKVEN
jgi:hypothetical protein